MAIDTAQKRRSAYAMTLPGPDGTIGQADRQHARWIYTGILAATPSAIPNRIVFSNETLDFGSFTSETFE
jgi:hypothetical protein